MGGIFQKEETARGEGQRGESSIFLRMHSLWDDRGQMRKMLAQTSLLPETFRNPGWADRSADMKEPQPSPGASRGRAEAPSMAPGQ